MRGGDAVSSVMGILIVVTTFTLPLVERVGGDGARESTRGPFMPVPSARRPRILGIAQGCRPLRSRPASRGIRMGGGGAISRGVRAAPTDSPRFAVRSTRRTQGTVV